MIIKSSRIVFFINTLLLFYITVSHMLNASQAREVYGLGKFYFLFVFITLLFLLHSCKGKISYVMVVPFLLMMYMSVVILCFWNQSLYGRVESVVTNGFWFFVFAFYLEYTRRFALNQTRFLSFLQVVFAVFAVIYSVSIFKNGLGADNYHGQNIVYYIMIFLPFLLCLESDFLKNTYLILMGILVAVSFKTTAMISYAVTLCIFFIWKKDSRGVININGLHIRKVFWFLVAILVLAGILQTIENRTDNYLVTKLNKSFTSGGSGRDVIWERTWNAQKMSNPVQWIFGHGSIIVAQANGLGNSAHNDFLEITFNYGLVGLILYLNIYLMLIKQAWRAYKIKSPMFVPWMASMILFAITSTFSHMITYPQYFPILMCFWGIAMGRPEEDSINNRMERSVHVRNSWDCISKI